MGLPSGYGTVVGERGVSLSGGQRQRIGLARALYGDPFFILLDEPNSNLDGEGEAALAAAIASVRKRGGILVVISHRADILGRVSHIMLLRGGRMEAFGPAAEIMARLRQKPKKLAQENVVAMQGAGAGKL